jgi:hypothetical protein
MSDVMSKAGRPTKDPKRVRVTLRLARRDVQALRVVGKREDVGLSEAARRVLRRALGIPDLPLGRKRRRAAAGQRGDT